MGNRFTMLDSFLASEDNALLGDDGFVDQEGESKETRSVVELSPLYGRRASDQQADGTGNANLNGPGLDLSRNCVRVSKQKDRNHKDRKIYLHPTTGLPVRPPTSFGLFKHAYRRRFKDAKVDFKLFNTAATERWTQMSAQEKEPYVERAKMLADHYKKIEVPYLRKRVRQLQQEVRDYRYQLRG